jgi:hypothetical protein
LLLAGLLAVGTGVVVAVALVWSFVFADHLFGPVRHYEYLVVRSDGTPLIASSPLASQSEVLRTLDGVEVRDEGPVQTSSGARIPLLPRDDATAFPLAWEHRIIAFSDDRRPPVYWYFIHDGKMDGSAYFVGYERRSRARVGYIGLHGFQPDGPRAEDCIPVDGRLIVAGTALATPSYYPSGYEPYYGSGTGKVRLASGNRVLEVDLRQRSVRTLLEISSAPKGDQEILGLTSYGRPMSRANATDDEQIERWRSLLLIRTSGRILLADFAGRVQRSYPLPEELRGTWFGFWEISDGMALIDRTSGTPEGNLHELSWINTAGKVVRQREVVLESEQRVSPARVAWLAAATVPAPIVAAFAVPLAAGATEIGPYEERSVVQTYRRGLPHAWPALAAVVAAAVAMAWLCYRRQRRYAQPWTIAWVIFVFLGGVPGLAGYLLHRRWPVLEACPACGAVVPRDRERCTHCRAEFPAPSPKGTEVFAA